MRVPNTWQTDESPAPPETLEWGMEAGAWRRRLTGGVGIQLGLIHSEPGRRWPKRPWPGWRLAYIEYDRDAAVYGLSPLHWFFRLHFVLRSGWYFYHTMRWLGFLEVREGGCYRDGRWHANPFLIHWNRKHAIEQHHARLETRRDGAGRTIDLWVVPSIPWKVYRQAWWEQAPWRKRWW